MVVSYKTIGRHIRSARRARSMTQEQVAEAMKFSVAHYGRLERGEREINVERLAQLSILLHTPIEHLIAGCVIDAPADIVDARIEDVFINEMARFKKYCKEETLQRMLRVCCALAEEDRDTKKNDP